jgi:chromosome partitioning protein
MDGGCKQYQGRTTRTMLLSLPARPDLRKILILNPKGGAGKTTLATNVAGYLANQDRSVALMDFDPQQSSMRWLKKRPCSLPPIHGIAAHARDHSVTRSFQYRVPLSIEYLVVDTPAGIPPERLIDFTRGAHAILVPVLPSSIDIRAASELISALLLRAKLSRRMGRLGIVVNRARENTKAFKKLIAFLDRLSISAVTVLRDSQNFVRGGELGVSIHDMRPSEVHKDMGRWRELAQWLESRLDCPLTARDLYDPSAKSVRTANGVSPSQSGEEVAAQAGANVSALPV